MRNERKKVWIDRLQTRLVIRILIYLAAYVFVLGNLLFMWRLIDDEGPPGNLIHQYLNVFTENAPFWISLMFLMLALGYDGVRLMHRVVGPLVRLRRAMIAIANGETVQPFKTRKGDHIDDVRDAFNLMLESLQRRGVAVLKPHADEQPTERQTA